MPLRFVADEQLRNRLLKAVRRHNGAGGLPIDLTQVGDPPDLPRSTPDPAILIWAEREGRIIVSLDANTMPGHLANHLAAGHTSPGVLILKPGVTLGAVVAFLELAAHAGNPADYAGAVTYIP